MIKNFTLGFIIFASVASLKAQNTQTIRGKILDEVSKTPLIGASVVVITGIPDKFLGGVTDTEGNYRIENVSLGRQTLKVSYIGYEEQVIPNVIVTAGKEVVMNFSLTEISAN